MFTSSLVLVSVLLAGPASAKKSASNDWDPAAASAIEAKIRAAFKDFDSGNMDTFMSWADTTAITWDIGMEGEPVTASTPGESKKMLEGYADMMKSGDMSVKTTMTKADCHATSSFGFCAIDFDQMVTAKGTPMPVMKFRATLVARMVDGDWRWSHWHASWREPMAMPAETAPM